MDPRAETRKQIQENPKLLSMRNEQGQTLLFETLSLYAQDSKYKEVVLELLECGAKVTDTNAHKRTPLHMALEYDAPNFIAILPDLIAAAKKQNFNFNQEAHGLTLLMLAIHATDEEKTKTNLDLLLKSIDPGKIDLNKETAKNLPPLFLAIIAREPIQKEAALMLVRAGADPEKVCNLNKINTKSTPLNQTVLDVLKIEKSNNKFQNQLILARLMYLTEQTLQEYEKDRSNPLRTGAAQQRTDMIIEIRTYLSKINTTPNNDPQNDISDLIHFLHERAQKAITDHKQHATIRLFGHPVTESGFAKKLAKLTTHSILKHAGITTQPMHKKVVVIQ